MSDDATTVRSLQLDQLRVAYTDHGSGTPLVLVHGGLATGAIMWGARVPELAQQYRVIVPDTRGHGRTNNPAGRLRYEQLADDLAAVITALGLVQPFVLGYSDGAQIALELGLRHPALARALVLGGVVSRPTERYLATLAAMGVRGPGQFDAAAFAQQYPEFYAELTAAHSHVYGAEYLPRFLAQTAELWYSVPDYTDAILASIGVWTLLITGDRDESDSLAESLRLYQLLPHAELAVIPNAGHGAGETPLFWYAVHDFLLRQTS